MKLVQATVIPLALTACATVPSAEEPAEVIERPVACDNSVSQRFVGQLATEELGGEIKAATKASIFQWVPPGTAVTRDFRPNRVRVYYDENMRITSVQCG